VLRPRWLQPGGCSPLWEDGTCRPLVAARRRPGCGTGLPGPCWGAGLSAGLGLVAPEGLSVRWGWRRTSPICVWLQSWVGWAQQPFVGVVGCGVILGRRRQGAGDYICIASCLAVTNDSAWDFSPTCSACSGRLSHQQLPPLVHSLFDEELAPALPGVHLCTELSWHADLCKGAAHQIAPCEGSERLSSCPGLRVEELRQNPAGSAQGSCLGFRGDLDRGAHCAV